MGRMWGGGNRFPAIFCSTKENKLRNLVQLLTIECQHVFIVTDLTFLAVVFWFDEEGECKGANT